MRTKSHILFHSFKMGVVKAVNAFRQTLDAFEKLRKATISFIASVCPSVHPLVRPSAWNDCAPNGRIFVKILSLNMFGKSVEKIQFSLKP